MAEDRQRGISKPIVAVLLCFVMVTAPVTAANPMTITPDVTDPTDVSLGGVFNPSAESDADTSIVEAADTQYDTSNLNTTITAVNGREPVDSAFQLSGDGIKSITIEIRNSQGELISGLEPKLDYVYSGTLIGNETAPGVYEFTPSDVPLSGYRTAYYQYRLLLSEHGDGDGKKLMVPVDNNENLLPGPLKGWIVINTLDVVVDGQTYTVVQLSEYPAPEDNVMRSWVVYDQAGNLVTDQQLVQRAAKTAVVSQMMRSEETWEQFMAETYPSKMRYMLTLDRANQVAIAIRDASANALGTIAGAVATGGTATVAGKTVTTMSTKQAMKAATKEIAVETAKGIASQYNPAEFKKNPLGAFQTVMRAKARSEIRTSAAEVERTGELLQRRPDDKLWTHENATIVWRTLNDSLMDGILWSEVRVRTMPSGAIDEQLVSIGSNFAEGATGAPVTEFTSLLMTGNISKNYQKAIRATADTRKDMYRSYLGFAELAPAMTEQVKTRYGTTAEPTTASSESGKIALSVETMPTGSYALGEAANATLRVTNNGDSARRVFVGYSVKTIGNGTPLYFDNDGTTGSFVVVPAGESVLVNVSWRIQPDAPDNTTYDAIFAVWDGFPDRDATQLASLTAESAFTVTSTQTITVEHVTAMQTVTAGEPAFVTVTLRNVGPINDSTLLTLRSGQDVEDSIIQYVDAGESIQVRLSYQFDTPGTYEVSVAGYSFEITVTPESDTLEDISIEQPAAGATETSVNPTITWTGPSDANYDVYIEAGDQTPDELVASNLTATSVTPNLEAGTTYYIKIVGQRDGQTVTSEVRTFTTRPDPPEGEFTVGKPIDGASDIGLATTLEWTGPEWTRYTEYLVYLDSDRTVKDGELLRTTRRTQLDLDNLEPGTTYYWRVVAKDGDRRKQSPVWSFTTAPQSGTISISDISVSEVTIDGANQGGDGETDRAKLSLYVTANEISSESGGEFDVYVRNADTGVLLATETGNTDGDGYRMELELELKDDVALFKYAKTYTLEIVAVHHTSTDKVKKTVTVNVDVAHESGSVTVLPERPTVSDTITIDGSRVESDSGDTSLSTHEWLVYSEDGPQTTVPVDTAGPEVVSFDPEDIVTGPEVYEYLLSDAEDGRVAADGGFVVYDDMEYFRPDMSVGDLNAPAEVTEGTPVKPSIRLTNDGGVEAHYIVRWKVDGNIVDSADGEVWYRDRDESEPNEDTESTSLYLQPGEHTITVVVIDSAGEKHTRTTTVTVVENDRPAVSNPTPADVTKETSSDITLQWSASDPNDDELSYTVLLEAGDSTPDETVATDLDRPQYSPSSLENGTTYYWQVIVTDEHGRRTTSPVWKFTTETIPSPTAAFEVETENPRANSTIRLNASASTPATAIDSYQWDLDGDGMVDRTTTTPWVDHTFQESGIRTITLTVVTEQNRKATVKRTVSIREVTSQNGRAISFETQADSNRSVSELLDRNTSGGIARVSDARASQGNQSLHLAATESGGAASAGLTINVTGIETLELSVYVPDNHSATGSISVRLAETNATLLNLTNPQTGAWFRYAIDVGQYSGHETLSLAVEGNDTAAYIDSVRFLDAEGDAVSPPLVDEDASDPGGACVAGAVSGSDKFIGLREIQNAIANWAENRPIAGKTVTLPMIQQLINIWAEAERVTC